VYQMDGNDERESWGRMTDFLTFTFPFLPSSPLLSLPLSISHRVARPSPPDIKKSYREAKRRAGVARPLCAMVRRREERKRKKGTQP
jgi:hypothetical protein